MKQNLFILSFFIFHLSYCFAQRSANIVSIDPLKGKKIGFIGDSYVRNHREPIENTWHYKFAKKHGMEYYNYGRNGNCIALDLKQWGIGMYNRYTEMRDDLDYVVVIAGHNDASQGRLDSIGIDTFKERLGILCVGLIESIHMRSCSSLPHGLVQTLLVVRVSWWSMPCWRSAAPMASLYSMLPVEAIFSLPARSSVKSISKAAKVPIQPISTIKATTVFCLWQSSSCYNI
jgi:hypothetical protein